MPGHEMSQVSIGLHPKYCFPSCQQMPFSLSNIHFYILWYMLMGGDALRLGR